MPGVTTNHLTLRLNGDVQLTAIFGREGPPEFVRVEGLGGGRVRLIVRGAPDARLVIASSTNLIDWTAMGDLRLDAHGSGTLEVESNIEPA